MSTQQVSYTVPSDSWTGSVDVSDADLLTDVSVEDYEIYYNDVQQGSAELANWAKTSSVLLTYSGSSLDENDVVIIRRKTPNEVVQTVSPQTTIQSSLWNAEFDRIIRWREEIDLFGLDTTSATVSDEAYGAGWNGVTSQPPSKNAVYDAFETGDITPAGDWTFSGSVDISGNTTFTGSVDMDGATEVLVPTNSQVALGGEFTTDAASQAWVYENGPFQTQMGGRLTPTTGTPVPGQTNTTSGTLYYTPYNGEVIWLYNTTDTRWEKYTFSEVSLSVTMTADRVYAAYIYDNSGTLTLELEIWSAYNTPPTLAQQNGVYVKNGSANKRFLGHVAAAASNTIHVDTGRFSTNNLTGEQGIWNYYNRVPSFFANAGSSQTVGVSVTGLNCGKFRGIFGTTGALSNVPVVSHTISGTASTTLVLTSNMRIENGFTGATIYDEFAQREYGVSNALNASHTTSNLPAAATYSNFFPIANTTTGNSTSTISFLSVKYEW